MMFSYYKLFRVLVRVVMVVTLFLKCGLAMAQDGELDLSFGDDGKVITDFAEGTDNARAVAIQANGKIVVAGYSDSEFALVRYNSDGSIDTGFGNNGSVITDFAGGTDYGYAMAIQSDNKIVVAGYSDNDFGVARYNNDGSPDTDFGSGGIVTTDFQEGSDIGYAVAIQSDSKIVVAGYSSGDFGVARYNSDGTLDTGFDSDGKVTTDFVDGNDFGYALAIQSDNKIVVAGYANTGSSNDFALVRYNSNGSLDTNFGSGGKVTTDFFAANDIGYALAIQSDGKLVVTGYAKNGTHNDFALARYNSDGSLDTDFGGAGKVTTDFLEGNDVGYALAIQSDGKLIVAGYASDGSTNDFALARYNIDGSLDTDFGSDGKVVDDFLESNDVAHAIAIQSDYNLVVAGYANNGNNNDFALARYLSGDKITGSAICDQVYLESCAVSLDIQITSGTTNSLGSFTATLTWDETIVAYNGHSGMAENFSSVINEANVAEGSLTFSGVDADGISGLVDVLTIYFDVIGEVDDVNTFDLEFSAMAAAGTFEDLLPALTINDSEMTVDYGGFMGDINNDGLVNSTDALIALSYDISLSIPDLFAARINSGFGDVNDDAATNSTDALIILSHDVGLDVSQFNISEQICENNN